METELRSQGGDDVVVSTTRPERCPRAKALSPSVVRLLAAPLIALLPLACVGTMDGRTEGSGGGSTGHKPDDQNGGNHVTPPPGGGVDPGPTQPTTCKPDQVGL